MITKELVQKLAQERIDELDRGLFIVAISISPKFVINLELDKVEGYVAIDDCVSVSRNVEHNLDREEQDFELHVSSAGLDKPLRVLPQYVKNIGRIVEVILKDGKEKEGVLYLYAPCVCNILYYKIYNKNNIDLICYHNKKNYLFLFFIILLQN